MSIERGVAGLHHVTAIAGDPGANHDFYADVLGLRFVKRTVNFDDPTTYHLYYGDAVGTPGTALTFFPFGGVPAGRPGQGQATETAFAVPPGTVDDWADRLASHDVAGVERFERFDESGLRFADHDGQPLALVAAADGDGDTEPWGDGPVPRERAIRGFHGVTLASTRPDATAEVLATLGYERAGAEEDRTRFRAGGDRATVVDLRDGAGAGPGRQGAGTVHHVAFRTADRSTQDAWRERLTEAGLAVTPVRDRQYFRSIYFREPGGVLFEIATDGPGFTADEDREALGTALQLPPWLEDDRERLESTLAPLGTPADAEAGAE